MLPFVFLFVKIGEVRREELGHPESLDLVRPEDLGHLLVGPSGVKYRLFTGYLRDGSRQFNRANRGNRISLKTDSFV